MVFNKYENVYDNGYRIMQLQYSKQCQLIGSVYSVNNAFTKYGMIDNTWQ